MSLNDTSEVCVVCFKSIEILSIGDCDHAVCFECSTRMRVLCQQTECPICRRDISKVIFTYKVEPYKDVLTRVNNKKHLYDDKYKIFFMDSSIKEAYNKLLEHLCGKCGDTFKLFIQLKDHMNKEHDHFFCDLCVENLKIFTSERKCYTRQQLALHRTKGDPDDTSHKGHPICKFCNKRYMDNDELFRHLRKEHLYCHLCDADGYHQYYESFAHLREHFRDEHFLCEEGECCSEGNMTVFRTQVDFKAHKASEHGRGLSKLAARQARTLEVQFISLTPRPTTSRTHNRSDRSEGDARRVENNRETSSEHFQEVENPQVVDMDSIKQFPTLGDPSGTSVNACMNRQEKAVLRQTSSALARTEENFPALSSDPSPGPSTSFRLNISHPLPTTTLIQTNVKPNVCIQVHNQAKFSLAKNGPRQNTSEGKRQENLMANSENNCKVMEEFPSLSKKDKNLLMNNYTSYSANSNNTKVKSSEVNYLNKGNIATQVCKAPPPSSLDAFPALEPSTTTTNTAPTQPQWIKKGKTKEMKSNKVNTNVVETIEPVKVEAFINNIEQFPAPPPISGSLPWTRKGALVNKPSEWTTPKQKEHTNKVSKVAPAPVIPSTQQVNVLDFPSLKPKHKKKSKEVETDINDNSINSVVPKKKDNRNNIDVTSKEDKNHKNKKKINLNNKQENKPGEEVNKKRINKECNSTESNANIKMDVAHCNGFTFTNSSGQSYEIPHHSYIQPVHFNERNKLLVSKFMGILGKTEAIHEFKLYSQLFREGKYSAECYYSHCKQAMKDAFNDMFPELLALLPDIRKQQELHQVHMSNGEPLDSCNVCGQVLLPDDIQFHKDFHVMQTAFPALGASVVGTSKQHSSYFPPYN